MSVSDERYFPTRATLRAYWTLLRREMKWWNWIAALGIVVVAPLALLIWFAAAGQWLGFATALIALIGAGSQAMHNIQQRHERDARLTEEAVEAEDP